MNWPFYHFETFPSSQLMHAVTTRSLGAPVTDEPYSDLNLAFHVGDNPDTVRRNRREMASRLGYNADALHAAQQVHGTCAHIVTPQHPAPGALDWETAWPDTDALITRHTDVPVMILVADCAPILLADFENRVLAVVHAGWVGSPGTELEFAL